MEGVGAWPSAEMLGRSTFCACYQSVCIALLCMMHNHASGHAMPEVHLPVLMLLPILCREEGVVEARSVDAALQALTLDKQEADRHPEK